MLKKSSFYPSVGFSATSSRKTELENQLNFGNNEMKLEKPEEQIVEPEYCPHVSPWTPSIDLQTKLELDYGFETISSYKTYIPSNLTSTSQNLIDHFDDKFYLENESDLDISSDDDLEYLVQSHCKMPFSDFSLTNNENAMEFPEAFNIIVDILDDWSWNTFQQNALPHTIFFLCQSCIKWYFSALVYLIVKKNACVIATFLKVSMMFI